MGFFSENFFKIFVFRKEKDDKEYLLFTLTCSVWAEFTWYQFSFLPPSGYEGLQGHFGNRDLTLERFVPGVAFAQKQQGSAEESSRAPLLYCETVSLR